MTTLAIVPAPTLEVALPFPGFKWCSGCEEWKTQSEFSKNKWKLDGLQNWCKACVALANKTWQTANRPKINERRRRAYHAAKIPSEPPKQRLKMVRVGETAFSVVDVRKVRYCLGCNRWKPRYGHFYRRGYCLTCRAERAQAKATPQPKPNRGAFYELDLTTGMGLYIVQFLNAKGSLSPKTIKGYRDGLSYFAQHTGNKWPFDADDINAFLAAKKADGRKPATVQSYYRCIRTFAGWLFKRKKIDTNPMEMAEKPPTAKLLPRAPKREHVQILYNWLQRRVGRGGEWRGERDLAVFSLMIDTGLRVGEVARLKISDIDLTRRTVTLRDTKTRADGTSVFGWGAAANLQVWLEVKARLDLPADLKDHLFVGYVRGEWLPLSEAGIRQFLARCCKERNLPHITPHQLRHGCAVFSLQGGANIIDVQRQLRHRTAQMTLRYLMMADEGREERHLEYSPFDKALGGIKVE